MPLYPPTSSGGSPGGATGDVQYNNAGAFGAEAPFTYDSATNQLTLPGVTINEDLAITSDITPTALTTDQDDWNPTSLATAGIIRIDMSASVNISGLQGGADGRLITLFNITTDYICILTHEDPASSAANRFNFGQAIPFYVLLPGEGAQFWYDSTSSRWRFLHGNHDATLSGQFDQFTDFCGGDTAAVLDSPFDLLFAETQGTAATAQSATYGTGATEKPVGIAEVDTGSTATGRAHLCSPPGNGIATAQSGVFIVCRLAVETLSDGTQTHQVRFGLHDAALGTDVTDGVYWEGDSNANAAWQSACAGASTRTKTVITGLTIDTTYITLGIWVNPAWTRADFFHSLDSISWIVAADGTQSGVNMPTATELVDISVGINKTLGSTLRALAIDWLGWRFTGTQR